nr:translation initiation factor IF-2-like [Aegilops tauschii subsp. strangulata]
MAPEGAPQAPTSEAPLVVEPRTAPASEPASDPEREPEGAPASREAASGGHALVPRPRGRGVAGSQASRSGTRKVFFGPPTQEEAAMPAVTRRLRGRMDRIQAFAQAEVEATQELERAGFLLEMHRRLKERLATKEEELRAAAAEVLSWRTRLILAGFHYDRLVADAGRLGAEVERARVEATGARRALDEAGQLREQLAGDKGRLEVEVERLKEEAAKVVEAQRALAEAEVGRLKALVATAEETRQGKTRCREEAVKAAEGKDAELKAALAKVADLEKALQERDRTIPRERHGTFLEVQHLEESFSRAFPETRQLAEEAVRFRRDPQGIVSSGTDPQVAWTFSEIVTRRGSSASPGRSDGVAL